MIGQRLILGIGERVEMAIVKKVTTVAWKRVDLGQH